MLFTVRISIMAYPEGTPVDNQLPWSNKAVEVARAETKQMDTEKAYALAQRLEVELREAPNAR